MSTVNMSAGGSSGLAKWLVVAAIVVGVSVSVAFAGTSKLANQAHDDTKTEAPASGQTGTTASGLRYHIVDGGTGESPIASDTVLVNYQGMLPDGRVFDSSYQRGQPAAFRLDQIIPGWTEGIQLMRKGGKARFTIPPALAYGEAGAGNVIPPNATLIFDIELLEIAPRQPQ